MNEKDRLSTLRWQCRRGMLELDVILGRFLESTFSQLSPNQQDQFATMLTLDDPTLYAWLMGSELPTSVDMQEIVQLLKKRN
ncbi:MAG: YgfY [Pseudomonadota bacterium]|jgi:antitoxin CptB